MTARVLFECPYRVILHGESRNPISRSGRKYRLHCGPYRSFQLSALLTGTL